MMGQQVPTDDALTIVLTLKGRHAFTARWMAYAAAVRLPFPVLVADGGADDGAERLLCDGARFPGVRYQYVRSPVDRTYADFYAKIASALSRVRTPLVVLADNDDFFMVDGLRAAVDFLTTHPEYAACGGQEAGFWVASGSSETGSPIPHPGPTNTVYGSHVEWKWSVETESLDDDTASARIRRKALKTTSATYYYVQRTDALRRHFEAIGRVNPQDLFLFEQLLSFLIAVAGKAKQLESLYLARQHNAPGSAAAAHTAVAGDWLGRMLTSTWSADFDGFLEVAARALAAHDGIPEEQARTCIVEAYRMEVAPALLGDLLKEPTVTVPMCLTAAAARALLQLRPASRVRRAARRLYRSLGWISTDAVRGTALCARPVPRAAEAFRPVHEFLRQPSGA